MDVRVVDMLHGAVRVWPVGRDARIADIEAAFGAVEGEGEGEGEGHIPV